MDQVNTDRTEYAALRQDMEQLRADIAAMSSAVRDDAADEGRSALNKMRETLDATQRRVNKLAEQATHQVEERPLVSLAGAFGIGMVLGTVLGRKI